MPKPSGLGVGEVFALAMRAWESGDGVEARRLARQIADSNPNFGGAHYLLGLVSLAQGQARKAAEHLARAVAADPVQAVPRLALGQALEAQDSLNAAIIQYRAILDREPAHAEAHARLGALLARQGKAEEAEAHCRKALGIVPRHPEALHALGMLCFGRGEDAEAASLLEQALALRPGWAGALHNYGLVLRRLGLAEKAAAILTGAVELRRDHAGTRANLAGALRAMGRLDEARTHAEKATRLDPSDSDGWVELGLVRQAKGVWDGAAAAFERAVTADPRAAQAHWCLAEARRVLGQSDRAARHYRRCLDLDPSDRLGAALGLAQLGAAPVPERAPDAYVRQLFDDYAARFDTALVEGLEYRAPALLADALTRVMPDAANLAVLDAGCGTGLAGPALRPRAKRLEGVDLSPAMVDKARERGLYDSLAVDELETFLARHLAAWDLIAAADVLVYFGALEPVMAAAFGALRPGGAFAFTVERAEDCESYRLGAKNRYAHAAPYVTARAEAAGFTLSLVEDAVTRRDGGVDVPGLLVVLRKD